MSKERDQLIGQIVELKTGLIEDTKEDNVLGTQNITINDSQSEAVKILVPNYSSDEEYLREGKVDKRRFSNIAELDVYWLAWFRLIEKQYGGEWSKNFTEEFLNLRDSVGGEHKKIGIEAIEALGEKTDKNRLKDKRSILEKYITKRGKPEYE